MRSSTLKFCRDATEALNAFEVMTNEVDLMKLATKLEAAAVGGPAAELIHDESTILCHAFKSSLALWCGRRHQANAAAEEAERIAEFEAGLQASGAVVAAAGEVEELEEEERVPQEEPPVSEGVGGRIAATDGPETEPPASFFSRQVLGGGGPAADRGERVHEVVRNDASGDLLHQRLNEVIV